VCGVYTDGDAAFADCQALQRQGLAVELACG
jgi:hypothetical protein